MVKKAGPSKDVAILSCYIRYRPNKSCYNLSINSRILAKYLLSLNKKFRASVKKKGNLFYFELNEGGNYLQMRKNEVIVNFLGNKLLDNDVVRSLKDPLKKNGFATLIFLVPSQFGLTKYDLYPDPDAACLARELERNGFRMPERIMTSSFDHDLEFRFGEVEVLLEITRTSLSRMSSANFKHQAVGGNIRAHIFDTFRKCVMSKLFARKTVIGFVILQDGWKNVKHIIDILGDCEAAGCYLLFIDFSQDDWPKIVSEEIKTRLFERNLLS